MTSKNRFILCIVIILFSAIYGFSQNQKKEIDSLITHVDSVIRDSLDYAFDISEIILEKSQSINYKFGIAKSYSIRGYYYFRTQQYNASKEQNRYAIKLYEELKDSFYLAKEYMQIADSYSRLGIKDTCIIYNKRAESIFQKIKNPFFLSIAQTSIGLLKMQDGEFFEAEKYFLSSYKLRESVNNQKALATAKNNLGVLYWRWGRLADALENYEAAIQIRKEINDLRGQIFPTLNIGLILIDLLDFDYAFRHITEGLAKAESINFKRGIAVAYLYLAELEYKRGNFGRSLEYAKNAHNAMVSVVDELGIIRARILTAKSDLKLNNFREARKNLSECLKLLIEKPRSVNLVSEVYSGLAYVEFHSGNYQKAIFFVDKSFENENINQVLYLVKENYLLLSNINEKLGNHKNALSYYRLFSETRDSLYNSGIVRALTDWRIKFETSVKEAEVLKLKSHEELANAEIEKLVVLRNLFVVIAFLAVSIVIILFVFIRNRNKLTKEIQQRGEELEKLNKLLTDRNDELNISNLTKDKLFSIISHDLRNPFSGLLGLTEEMSDNIEEMNKAEISESASIIKSLSTKLYSLTQTLLDWSQLNTKSLKANIVELKINKIIESVIEANCQFFESKEISLDFITEEKELNASFDEQMLKTIIHNLLFNALKFTSRKGQVKIYSKSVDKFVNICVVDNGVGIENDKLERIKNSNDFYSSNGTANEQGTGLGLSICYQFAKLNNAEITIKSTEGLGSEFCLQIPKQ